MVRAPRNEQEEREMYCRLAYLIPGAFIAAVLLAVVLGSAFRGLVAEPPYAEREVMIFGVFFTTIASVICLALARPRWWHLILWPATVLVLVSLLFPYFAMAKMAA